MTFGKDGRAMSTCHKCGCQDHRCGEARGLYGIAGELWCWKCAAVEIERLRAIHTKLLRGETVVKDNAIRKLEDLAARLNAVGRWQCDQAQEVTETGKLLLDSAAWLKKAARNVCGQGFFGCRLGPDCDSDHK